MSATILNFSGRGNSRFEDDAQRIAALPKRLRVAAFKRIQQRELAHFGPIFGDFPRSMTSHFVQGLLVGIADRVARIEGSRR